ncbi:MAG: phospho-N-acetylmuramoyl-pentapeptide-transferase [Candidatus Eremiobacteraeota bacterium]|nr:phospho-N-acetylmuramoyl-pentapeptide-transferase [Candidatus Eremiobacteraeota bacterium]
MNAPPIVLLVWALFGFTIGIAAATLLLGALTRLHVRQHAYEDAPQSHQEKTGTPTMGGLAFVIVLLAALAVVRTPSFVDLVFFVLLCAAIGAVDDSLKIRHGANRGLPARTKLLATALAATMFLRVIDAGSSIRDVLFHVGTFAIVAPHWLWLLLGIMAITGTIHAVNLTDGLDGLAAGTMIPPLTVIALAAAATGISAAAIGAAAGAGACAAFLLYNRHPARLFMGDTGSLALGALLAGSAILTGEMLLLVVIGGVFVAEALSVIAQVSYFKASGGRRIFRMSPLHHHFELAGWPETKVTIRFWLASLICSLVGWAIVR